MPTNARLALFASGDFACNLFWQSLTYFLLFFYTEVLGLTAGIAGLVLLIGAVWDGIAALAVGVWSQRRGDYRRWMTLGAAPLGLSFVAIYLAPPVHGATLAIVVTAAHVAFRTCYVIVNVPFGALSAIISRDSAARSRIAALRMFYGATAAIVVALVTRAASLTPQGTVTSATGYATTAAAFALVAVPILIAAARAVAGPSRGDVQRATGIEALTALLGNRAFMTLNAAAALTAIAGAIVNGIVLYYFTYAEHDASAGPAAMAWMGIAGISALPVWMAVRARIGTRGLWLVNAVFALAILACFAALGQGVAETQAFLFAIQLAMIGFAYAFWAMLPDTVEWGEIRHGMRLEGVTFGIATLAQKLALGLANALLGLLLSVAGYRGGHASDPGQIAAGLRAILLAVPSLAIFVSAIVMLFNPLRRDTHAAIVAAIEDRAAG